MKIEYKEETFDVEPYSLYSFIDFLNKQGEEGWILCLKIDTIVYFRREIKE